MIAVWSPNTAISPCRRSEGLMAALKVVISGPAGGEMGTSVSSNELP
ncbi:hypothetical protein I553_10731 [Mycobacterium xenopi 4042]|uniref:Uncharacterized protein n=1 Tax=Mycobacterium xenopi 4042 TaxID=1299334 RepID=X8DAP6_MYCXE|nr:hypothetical protein I553_10731 [Mycobacterium xenopi 4042]